MKIRVQRINGEIETINFEPGTWYARPGGELNTFTNETGFDHWFTPDGHYDGWGQMLDRGDGIGVTMDDAMEIIENMQAKRRTEPS